ncbi:hypothetical protein PR048_031995 [Dryococelus australis]|uniref:Uncharacterized protein n=1 Tax=Dryococelus australis TaxID=614101 RepID=A0ABQ9GAV8_9NEOP|nr:hypothetical protein PR048_031995 [Dryococelus australis]
MTSWALDCKLRLNFGGNNSGREVPGQTVSDPETCKGSGCNVADEGSDSDSTWCEEAERTTSGQPQSSTSKPCQDSTDTVCDIVSLTNQLSMKDENVEEMLEANIITQDSEALMDCALGGLLQLGAGSQQDARSVDSPCEPVRRTSDSTRYSLRNQPKRSSKFGKRNFMF